MKKLIFATSIIIAISVSSCCGCDDDVVVTNGHGHDSTVVEESHHEEETLLAFDGVDKGDYVLYGHSEITPDSAKSVTDMMTEMQTKGTFNDKVSVKISSVCMKAGCWIKIDDEKGGTIHVFFRDHFTIPIETPIGREAVLYGSLIVDTLSIDFQKHLLDDAKEAGEEIPQSEYDAITEDKIETTFDCESILVKKGAH